MEDPGCQRIVRKRSFLFLLFCAREPNEELLAESEIFQLQTAAGAEDAKDGSQGAGPPFPCHQTHRGCPIRLLQGWVSFIRHIISLGHDLSSRRAQRSKAILRRRLSAFHNLQLLSA